jgi:hypothetical protein
MDGGGIVFGRGKRLIVGETARCRMTAWTGELRR